MSDNEPTVEDYIREMNGLEPKKEPEPVKAEEQEAAATSTDGEDADAEETQETESEEGESTEEQEASADDEESDDSDEDEEEKPKRRRSRPDPKKRIRKLVAERNSERDENARLRAERDILLKQLQAQPGQQPAEQTPAQTQEEDPQPKQNQYPDYAEFLEARSAWAGRQAVKQAWGDLQKQAQEVHKQQTSEAREAEVVTQARALADRGRAEFEDFEEVAGDPYLPVTEAMTAAMLASDIGHQVQYHLGSNPEEAARISKLDPVQQVREMALLEASLTAPKAKPKKKTTSAPEPIKPVGGKSAPKSIDEDTMDIGDYMRKYNAGELPSQRTR